MLPWYDFAVLGPCGQVSNPAVPTSGSSAFPPRRRKNAALSLLGCFIAADGYMGVLALSCCWQPHLEYPCERTGGEMVAGRCRRGVVPCRQQPFGPCSQGPRRRRLAALFVKFAKLLAWPLSVPQQRIQIPPRPPAAPMPWTSIRHSADTTSPCAGAAAAAASEINNRNTKQKHQAEMGPPLSSPASSVHLQWGIPPSGTQNTPEKGLAQAHLDDILPFRPAPRKTSIL